MLKLETSQNSNKKDKLSTLMKVPESCQSDLWNLLKRDQLIQEKKKGRIFQGFEEGVVSFLPTYKYDKNSHKFDTSKKQRIPGWTDRILYMSHRKSLANRSKTIITDSSKEDSKNVILNLTSYYSESVMPSDHRPVIATFLLHHSL
jgi:hypothetical protein